jgi:hypothetical protein
MLDCEFDQHPKPEVQTNQAFALKKLNKDPDILFKCPPEVHLQNFNFFSLFLLVSIACQRTGDFGDEGGSATSAVVTRELTNAEITIKPIPLSVSLPAENPYTAGNGIAWSGSDTSASHLVKWAGPMSNQISAKLIEVGTNCTHSAITKSGTIAAVCGPQDGGYQVVYLDSIDQTIVSRINLPTPSDNSHRYSTAYPLIMDNNDGLMIGTPDQKILRVSYNRADPAGPKVEEMVDLRAFRGTDKSLRSDDGGVSAVSIDFRGMIWFATENGALGYYDQNRQAGALIRLVDPKTTLPEIISNHMVIAPDNAIFIITTHALYRIEKSANADGISIVWKEEVERGSGIKKGQNTQGSGTGPVLIGEDLIAIGDNREVRMSIMVYRRSTTLKSQRKFCEQPVFKIRNSAGEAAMAAAGNSIIAQNTFGYEGPDSVKDLATSEAGLARIEVNETDGSCKIVWNRPIAVPNLSPVISIESGQIYVYAKKGIGWYLAGVDFASGQTSFDVRVGGTDAYVAENGSLLITPSGDAFISHRTGFSTISQVNNGQQQSETMPLLLDQKSHE